MSRLITKLAIAAAVLGGGALVQPSWAGSQIYANGPSSCTGSNCASTFLNGTYDYDTVNHNANPFVLQVFSGGGECVRIDVTSAGTDLETVLVAPNGTTWRNDDRPGSTNPLVKALVPSGVRGWYTLSISRYNGGGPRGDFTMAYGRYTSGNPNCSGATSPALAAAAQASKVAAADHAMAGGTAR